MAAGKAEHPTGGFPIKKIDNLVHGVNDGLRGSGAEVLVCGAALLVMCLLLYQLWLL